MTTQRRSECIRVGNSIASGAGDICDAVTGVVVDGGVPFCSFVCGGGGDGDVGSGNGHVSSRYFDVKIVRDSYTVSHSIASVSTFAINLIIVGVRLVEMLK